MSTIKDVALKAGVSYTTVSHVINKTRPVSEEACKRVNEAIKELNYRPNMIARNLRKQNTLTIGVVNSINNDPYMAEVIDGLEKECYSEGYSVIVCHSELSVKKEKENIEMLLEKGVDGIIIHCLMADEHGRELLENEQVPVIFLQYYIPDLPADMFCTDDFKGGYSAAHHLVDFGHRKIACIAGYSRKENSTYHRKEGWEAALQENGITPPPEYLIETGYTLDSGYTAMKRLLRLPDPPTAAICYCDMQAMGAIRAAEDLGLRIPEDFSVVGYDNLHISEFTRPRLTTINQPKKELGVTVFHRLKERIHDNSIKEEQHTLPVELIIRESTGPLKK